MTASSPYGNLTVSLSKKGHLLGHSPHPGGLFWRAAEADGLRAVFLLLACCYQEAPRITGSESNAVGSTEDNAQFEAPFAALQVAWRYLFSRHRRQLK